MLISVMFNPQPSRWLPLVPHACCCLLQLGFFSIVGIPLFKAITDLFKDAQPMMDGLLANYRMWEMAAKESMAKPPDSKP